MSNDMGGPAFPTKTFRNTGLGNTLTHTVVPGMTLGDYFAAHALTGMMSNMPYLKDAEAALENEGVSAGEYLPQFVAEMVNKVADAMLDERRKRMSAKDESARESSIEKDGSG